MAEPKVIVLVKKWQLFIYLESWLLHQSQIMAVQLRQQGKKPWEIHKDHIATDFLFQNIFSLVIARAKWYIVLTGSTCGAQSGLTSKHNFLCSLKSQWLYEIFLTCMSNPMTTCELFHSVPSFPGSKTFLQHTKWTCFYMTDCMTWCIYI